MAKRCLGCDRRLPLKEFPKVLQGKSWVRELCWDCVEKDDDDGGYVIQIC